MSTLFFLAMSLFFIFMFFVGAGVVLWVIGFLFGSKSFKGAGNSILVYSSVSAFVSIIVMLASAN